MNLQAIREGLANAIANVDGVRAFAWPAEQVPTGQASVVTVTPASSWVDYFRAFSKGLAEVRYDLTVWVQASDIRAAMARLDALCSSEAGAVRSIPDALMDGDRTLGGACADLIVDSVSNVRTESFGDGARALCADLSVRVYVGRS